MTLSKLQTMLSDFPARWATIMHSWGSGVLAAVSALVQAFSGTGSGEHTSDIDSAEPPEDLPPALREACATWRRLATAACQCSISTREAKNMCRQAVFRVFFGATGQSFAEMYQRVHARDDHRLRVALRTTSDTDLRNVHVSDQVLVPTKWAARCGDQESFPFSRAVASLRAMCEARDPCAKAAALLEVVRLVCDTIQHYIAAKTLEQDIESAALRTSGASDAASPRGRTPSVGAAGAAAGTGADGGDPVGRVEEPVSAITTVRISADDLVGLVRYAIARLQPHHIHASIGIMEAFMSDEESVQEPGFYLTAVQMATSYMLQQSRDDVEPLSGEPEHRIDL